jgi:glucose-6-phosphate isomerase
MVSLGKKELIFNRKSLPVWIGSFRGKSFSPWQSTDEEAVLAIAGAFLYYCGIKSIRTTCDGGDSMSVQLVSAVLGDIESPWKKALTDIREQRIAERIWGKDYTVWKPAPEEIINRLGWLRSGDDFKDQWPLVEDFVAGVRGDGYTQALLLGMGGSSLASEIFRKIFGIREGFLDLSVCDTTAPATIVSLAERLDIKKTLFIVSTKSGGTVETLSAMKYFYHLTVEKIGEAETGRHFLAITDPGSQLAATAMAHRFRHIFYGDPNIGGRFSALSVFGLVPAALIGVDVKGLLKWTTDRQPAAVNLGVNLGAMLGVMARAGRNKVTYVLSEALSPFGDWVEQLIAESTGKEGKGILPVVGEVLGLPEVYGADRFFVQIGLWDENKNEPGLIKLKEAGHPVVKIALDHRSDLGELLYIWEIATAAAGYILEVNPFDQPDVEAAKQFTRQVLEQIQGKKSEKTDEQMVTDGDTTVYGPISSATDAGQVLEKFLNSVGPGHYIALQAYLPPEPSLDKRLNEFRLLLRDRYRVATTVGYGPRFLHSTGQLHKGDDGRGLFIQFTADNRADVAIPDEMTGNQSSLTFGALQIAQAQGDAKALESRRRRVIRFHFTRDSREGITKLINSLIR